MSPSAPPPELVPDLRELWDFARPDLTEQRLRERLAAVQAQPADAARDDAARVLQTQIARTHGLRRRFDEARALLLTLQPALAQSAPEVQARWHLEWGRTWASATHDRQALPPADRAAARTAFRTAAATARAAGFDGLAVDALHMLVFTTADRAEDLAFNDEALALALTSPQPAARRWEPSLRHNLAVTFNELGRHAEALAQAERALAALQAQGAPAGRLQVARWMVAHTLRRLGRSDEALAVQQALAQELDAAGAQDEHVWRELALLHRARGDSAAAAAWEARAAAAGR